MTPIPVGPERVAMADEHLRRESPNLSNGNRNSPPLPWWAAASLAGIAFGVVLFAMSMSKHLDHDEHQFVAPGALLARAGLLPYRDYPYFHVPYLLFLYAALDRVTSHLLLAARVTSVAGGTAILMSLFAVAYRAFARLGRRAAWAAGLVAGGALLTNPVFTATSGRAWNHDLPTLLLLLATFALWRGTERGRRGWLAAAGVLLGLAAGTRLTFAPVWLAFAVASYRGLGRGRRGAGGVLLMTAGCAAALLPLIAVAAAAPRAFLFGNFTYPALNTTFRRINGYPRAMTAGGKVAYAFKDLLIYPGNLMLFAACAASFVGLWHEGRRRRRMAGAAPAEPHPNRERVRSLAWVIGTLLVGSFAPTPLFTPYFFAPLPFAVLVVVLVAADERKTAAQSAGWRAALLVAAAVAIVRGLGALQHLELLGRPRHWTPMRVHAAGRAVARRVGGGGRRVLTFAPIVPLEGGCVIYPEFATGPFASRVADFVAEADERAFKEVDEDDLPALLAERPPAGVLVGVEGRQDAPLEAYARTHGMTPHRIARGDVLGPMRAWALPRHAATGPALAGRRSARGR